MITIFDIYGTEIHVTDLTIALLQADDFRHYETSDPAHAAFFERQRVYWEDIYQKILLLEKGDG